MIKSYFKIAWRNLKKHKGFSAINVLGLSLGLACFIMIGLYVMDEISYDRYNEKADRIFRVNSDIRLGGTDLIMAVSADPMGATLKDEYPEVEEFVRFYNSSGSKLIKKGDEYINEPRVTHVDSTLFNVFTLPSIYGDTKTALNEPNTVVLTKSTAERYFGNAREAMGQFIETDDNQKTLYIVTAVIEDIPKNSHFVFDFFFSMDNVNYDFGNFLSHNFHTYILLRPGVDYKSFNKNFKSVINKHILPQASSFMQVESMDQFEGSGNKLEYSLFPLEDIHLKSSRTVELGVNGNINYVYIFSAAAIFILLIACINFMNLTTARSAGRAKEVGIRKVLGSEKKALIWQFLTESTILAIIALVCSLGLIWLSIGWFNNLAGKEMEMSSLLSSNIFFILLILPFIVGGLAGIYPAFFLSAFKPIKVLKGKLTSGNKKSSLRSFLVVFQFSTSMILIIGTIVIFKQLDYIKSSKVGFNKEQVLVVDNTGIARQARETLKSEIEQLNDIIDASFAGYLPVSDSSRSDTTFSTEAVMTETNAFSLQYWRVDYDYIPTLGMEIVEGRNFSPTFGSDSTAIIINESAARQMNLSDPIGKIIYTKDGRDNETLGYTIVGIVKDFNFASLRNNVEPLTLRLGNNSWMSAYRFQTGDVAGLVKTVEANYKKMAPGMPFNYSFLDESFENMYRQEQRVGKVSLTFAILAILIACLGLFGLATYIAEQRTKEIGIRKVLGASVPNIIGMLSKDFLKLVLISFIVAAPLAYWVMQKWLQEFAYKIDLSVWIFIITGITAIIIAFLTLSFQAIKAAMSNPVKSLRTE